MRYTRMGLEAQVPPLLLALAFVIQYSVAPGSYLGCMFQGVQSKLYAVGLMYSLNARPSSRHDRSKSRHHAAIQVDVETETYTVSRG